MRTVIVFSLVTLALISVSFALDNTVRGLVLLPQQSAWCRFADRMSKLGEGWAVAIVGVAGTAILGLLRKPGTARKVFLAAAAGLFTGAAGTLIRSLAGRTRPEAEVIQGFYGVWHDSHWLIGNYNFGSFPSGHVATVAGFATAIWFLDRRLGVLAWVYALLVSWSRLAQNVHHFSDVIAAGSIGVFGACLFLKFAEPWLDAGLERAKQWLAKRRAPLAPPAVQPATKDG